MDVDHLTRALNFIPFGSLGVVISHQTTRVVYFTAPEGWKPPLTNPQHVGYRRAAGKNRWAILWAAGL